MADVLPSEEMELVEEPSDYGALQPGTRLGRYEMLVPIARGGMARVWAARLHGQHGFQKLVAVKVILPHLANEPEFERMFLDEARIASGVHHPNVCEIYELGEEKRTLYLVMEWVSGDSLARVLRSGGKTEAIDVRVAARIVADACAGVHAAHELTDDEGRALGVVHRDLSPHNILITAAGTAKVCDFGVAKALGQLHEATTAGQLKGKIAYMAPEQITATAVDRRSDVFSLGCVLYEATTGVRPFRGEGDHQVMHAILKGEPTPPTALLRGYPQELERIVLRALAPQPILRFPTAERMRFALEEFVARGQLVTQANVAQVMRARIGGLIDRRKERIRVASTAGDREGGWSEPPGNQTPSNQGQDGHRSGIKASNALLDSQPPQGARPLYSTMQLGRPQDAAGAPRAAGSIPAPAVEQAGSSTIPHAHPQRASHTPVSHPSHPSRPQPSQAPPAASSPPYPAPPGTDPNHRAPMVSLPSMAPLGASSSGQYPASLPSGPSAYSHHAGHPGAPPFDAPSGEEPAPGAGTGQFVLAIGIGLLLAAVIGGSGYYAWRLRGAASPVETSTTTRPVAPAATSASGIAAASPEITFRLHPETAILSVEGQDLPPAVRSFPRPAIGKTVNVVARAKGHDDVAILVDFFTASTMDLALKPSDGKPVEPKSDPRPPETDSATPPIATTATPALPTRERKPQPPRPAGKDPASGLPSNPY